MQYVKISFAIVALLGLSQAHQKSLSDYAREDDAITSGNSSWNREIGTISNQKELRPENFENAMTMDQMSISSLNNAIKKMTIFMYL